MSCPDRCSNNFKVKNFPDEIECVVADKVKGSTFQLTGPSNNLLGDNSIPTTDGSLNNVSKALNFKGIVRDASLNAVPSGTVLLTASGDGIIVAL